MVHHRHKKLHPWLHYPLGLGVVLLDDANQKQHQQHPKLPGNPEWSEAQKEEAGVENEQEAMDKWSGDAINTEYNKGLDTDDTDVLNMLTDFKNMDFQVVLKNHPPTRCLAFV